MWYAYVCRMHTFQENTHNMHVHNTVVEPFLDDSVPFRKFNNNDYVPGQQVSLRYVSQTAVR